MNRIPLACSGILIGSLQVPPFQLSLGDLICLHMPGLSGAPETEPLVGALTGQEPTPGLQVFGRVRLASPAPFRAGLFGLWHRPRPAAWLRSFAGLSLEQAGAVVARLGLNARWRICEISATARLLLGLEATWARGAEAIVFTAIGLDCLGRRTIFDAVGRRLDRCPAIHLCYAYMTQGRRERTCPTGAVCLEVRSHTTERLGPIQIREQG
jgi:hypothetical protein